MSNLPRPPSHLQAFVDVLGVDMAVELFLNFGGSEIYYPKKVRPNTNLTELVGVDQAEKLAAAYHAGLLPDRVPLGKPWIAEVLRAQGETVTSIARRLHMTDRWVRKHTSPAPHKDPRQLRLF